MNIPWLIVATVGIVGGLIGLLGEVLDTQEVDAGYQIRSLGGWLILAAVLGAGLLGIATLWKDFA